MRYLRWLAAVLILGFGHAAWGQATQRPANMSTDKTWVWNWSGSTFGSYGAASVPGIVSYGLTVNTLGTPSPSVSVIGTAGSTTWQYKVSSVAGGLETLPVSCQTTTGNASLTSLHYNRISWAAVTGANAYRVYRNVSGTYNRCAEVYVTLYNDTNANVPNVSIHPQTVGQTGKITSVVVGNAAGLSNSTGSLIYSNPTWYLTGNLILDSGSAVTADSFVGTLTGDASTATVATGVVLRDTATPAHYWRLTVTTGGTLGTTDLGTTYP